MSDKDSGSGGSESLRRRRLIKNPSPRAKVSCPSPPGSVDGSPQRNHGPSVLADVENVSVLSNPLLVSQIVSSFDGRKKGIVDSIGFGGLLCLPAISYQNNEFTFWLLKRFRWFTRMLTMGDNFTITLTPEHISKISGLSSIGIQIPTKQSAPVVEGKLAFIQTRLSFLQSSHGIIEAAQNYVLREFPSVLSKELIDNFKIAFVIFVVGRFLAPFVDQPEWITDFWVALQRPDEIGSYDWSSFILEGIRDAARLVNWDGPYDKQLSSLPGCLLILQIFYIDNIDFGPLNLSHDTLPRWQIYTNETIGAMIQADRRVPTFGSSRTVYGRTKLIRVSNTCYNFGSLQTSASAPVLNTGQPLTHPSTSCRGIIDDSSTPDHSESDTSMKLSSVAKTRYLSNFGKDMEKDVVDFPYFIRQKYQGQVDMKLLNDLSAHNARCLGHLHRSYRTLAANIVNENISLATKFIEHYSTSFPVSNEQMNNPNASSRRRGFDELVVAPDHCSEAQGNLFNSKVARPRIQVVSVSGNNSHNTIAHSSADVTAAHEAQKSLIHDGGQISMKTHTNASGLSQSYCQIQPSLSKNLTGSSPDSCSPGIEHPALDPIVFGRSPNDNIEHSIGHQHGHSERAISVQRHMTTDMHLKMKLLSSPSPNTVSMNRCPPPVSNQTPEATIKMSSLSPTVSPTTENQSFSGACLSIRNIDSITGIDLNSSSFEFEYHSNSQPKRSVCPGPLSLSHWEMNLKLPIMETNFLNLFHQVLLNSATSDLDRDWIIHSIPRFLKITGYQLKNEFALNKPMTFDTFDLSIRRIIQIDDLLYPDDIPMRWRHLVESDFALHALGYDNPVDNKFIREQFLGKHLHHDISRCRMFYVPVYVDGNWWCYGWDLKKCLLFIFDHSVSLESDSIVINRHQGSIHLLTKALTSIANELFNGWSPNFSHCKPYVFRYNGLPHKSVDSGLMTLFCIMNFDGDKLAVDPTEVKEFRHFFLYQLMEIQENCGSKPPAFQRYIA